MLEIGDRMLGRNGDLVSAAHARYADVLKSHPDRAGLMMMAGRAREITEHLRREGPAFLLHPPAPLGVDARVGHYPDTPPPAIRAASQPVTLSPRHQWTSTSSLPTSPPPPTDP